MKDVLSHNYAYLKLPELHVFFLVYKKARQTDIKLTSFIFPILSINNNQMKLVSYLMKKVHLKRDVNDQDKRLVC